jgi:DnaA family protein
MNKQLVLTLQINDEATLANFCWSKHPWLQQSLQAMLQHQGERFLYLWGPAGSGKSHLLQACCHEISSAMYLPLNLLKEWGPQSIENVEEQTLICIDDVQSIAQDAAWEEALFHLYNRVKDKEQGLLILAGTHPPASMPLLLADLRSRLAWGLVVQLHELDDEEKIATIIKLARQRGFELPLGVAQFLLTRCSRNMHHLYQLLNRLDQASLAAQRKLTIPFVKTALEL